MEGRKKVGMALIPKAKMKSSDVHTPTPWELHDIAPDDPDWEAFEIWAKKKLIGNGAGRAAMRVFGKTNAEFIVRACNAHEELLAILTELSGETTVSQEARERALAAIAHATSIATRGRADRVPQDDRAKSLAKQAARAAQKLS
jgi:hypothetical protein